ncbi:MAG: zinc-dependent metalloprotease [Roseivirga sp.]
MKKNRLVILLLTTLLIGSAPFSHELNAQRKKKKAKNETAEAVTPKPAAKKKPGKTYKSVIKGLETDEGLFKVHKSNDKVLYEIPKAELGKDMLWVTRLVQTPPDYSGFTASGSKVGEQVVRWEKVQDKIMLRKIQYRNVADSSSAIFNSVAANNLAPIIASFKIEAQPEDSTAYVVDVTNLFKQDVKAISGIPGFSRTRFQVRRLDGNRSYIQSVKSFPINVEVRQVMTFDAGRPPSEANTGSITLMVGQSLLKLPEDRMQPRLADERVGWFTLTQTDFSLDEQKAATKTYLRRWRLEPKDPAAYARGELVEPVKPIVYYLDPGTPEKFKKWFKLGIEDWQAAFEEAGFKNAILAKNPPTKEEDPDWSPEDARYSTVRYVANYTRNAVGPSTSDPRTGEIIESDIMWFHNHLRSYRNWFMIQTGAANPNARSLNMREEDIGEMMRQVIAHEIGHALGLPHNMKASSSYPVESYRDPEFAAEFGVAPTIMDYARMNYIAQPGDGVTSFIRKLGPYDKYSINWGYRVIPGADSPEAELKTLDQWILDKADDRRFRFGSSRGTDPETQTEDLGDNSVKASTYGMKNLMKVVPNLLDWTTTDGEDYSDTEEIYGEILGQWRRFVGHVATNVGGIIENKKSSDQDGMVFTVVPEKQQVEAMQWMHKHAFSSPEWLLDEELLRRMENFGAVERIRRTQTSFLNSLLDPTRAQRLIEAEAFKGRNTYTIYQLFGDVRKGLFSELAGTQNIDTYRRNLQRGFVARLGYMMNNEANAFQARQVSISQSDIRPAARAELKALKSQVNSAQGKYTDRASKVHLEDLLERINHILDPQ